MKDVTKAKTLLDIAPYAVCLVACAIVNLVYFPAGTIFPDEQRILNSAIALAASGEFRVAGYRAWEMPGTALFFAPWVWLLGPSKAVIAIRFAQTALLMVQCGLVAAIVQRSSQEKNASLIAACMVAVYPFFLFYQGLLLSETLFNTLLLAGLAALLKWRDGGLRIDAAFLQAIFFFAAATMTKATLTIFPPLLVAATGWLAGVSWRRLAIVGATAIVAYACLLAPWSIRNALVLGHFVPFTTSSGENLYLGNNPANPHVGIDWSQDVEPEFVKKYFAIPNEIERQDIFTHRAVAYIKDHPGAFLEAAYRKFLRFWNVIPNAAEFRGLYAVISALSFGPVLLFAVADVVWRRSAWRRIAPLLLVVGYFTAIHTITIASLRYRLAIEPVLIVFAADCLAGAGRKLRLSRDPRPAQ